MQWDNLPGEKTRQKAENTAVFLSSLSVWTVSAEKGTGMDRSCAGGNGSGSQGRGNAWGGCGGFSEGGTSLKGTGLRFWGCIFFSLLLLTVPLPWVLAAVTAAFFHEICHLGAIYALGGRIGRITAGGSGAEIEMGGLSGFREFLAAAAGPGGSFLLFLLWRQFPRLGICGFFQGIFNLLPVYPMDGGRMVRCLLLPVLGAGKTEKNLLLLEGTILGVLLFFLLRLPGAPGKILTGFLIFRIFSSKIPCKDCAFRVQ